MLSLYQPRLAQPQLAPTKSDAKLNAFSQTLAKAAPSGPARRPVDVTRDPRATHKLRVSNVVCNFHVNAPIDVMVCVHAMSGRYDKVIFPAMVSVCHETHTTNSCFDTRQIVVSGSRTELHALMASHLLVSALSYETCRHDLHMRNFKIQVSRSQLAAASLSKRLSRSQALRQG